MITNNKKKMKTILITGTSSGIGKATAKKFLNAGWNVIATMRSPEKEEELKNSNAMLVMKLEVTDMNSIQKAIDAGIEKFGKIDALMNNAGFGTFGAFETATQKQVEELFNVNVYGYLNVTRAILPHFRENGKGTLLNVSSQGGRITFPTCSLYHATKFAIEGFTESLSYELISENIEVKIIEPGATATSFVGSANMGENDSIINYQKFDEIALETYGKLNEKSQSTSDEIAEVILEAANDKSGQLRYIIGEDTKRLLNARNTMTDQEYVDYMRGTYIPEFWNEKINTSI